MRLTVQDFAQRCGGAASGATECEIKGFATDDREVRPGDLFVCINGERSDGHEFVASAFAKGACAALCTRPVQGPHVQVGDVVEALAHFGRSVRNEFKGHVIGVTGSAGKTTTKEMIASACSVLGSVLKSEGNKNTEYTSPTLWAKLTPETKSVVVEMGMRGLGQIAHLASIARPTVGVVTQIGTAHLEKVGSREGIFQAKSELLRALPPEGTAIVWQEDDFLRDLKAAAPCRVMTFGFTQEADCRVLGYRAVSWTESLVKGTIGDIEFETKCPTVGRHQALNVAAAVLTAYVCGADPMQAARMIAQAELPPMRLEIVNFQGATVVLDTYNASPDSTVASLRTLAEMPVKGRKIAVLGEMKELGQFTESGHRRVGDAVAESMIDLVLLTGGPTSYIADQARYVGFPSQRIQSLEEFDIAKVREFLKCVKEGDAVLIKGSRALGLERAVEAVHR